MLLNQYYPLYKEIKSFENDSSLSEILKHIYMLKQHLNLSHELYNLSMLIDTGATCYIGQMKSFPDVYG